MRNSTSLWISPMDRREMAKAANYERVTPAGMETCIAGLVSWRCRERWEEIEYQKHYLEQGFELWDDPPEYEWEPLDGLQEEMDILDDFDAYSELYDVDPVLFNKIKEDMPPFVTYFPRVPIAFSPGFRPLVHAS